MNLRAANETASERKTAPEGWIEVGRASRPHGLRGGLLVTLLGDSPSNLLRADRVRLRGSATEAEFRVRSAHPQPAPARRAPRVRMRLCGIEDLSAAESWTGSGVLIPESALEVLPEGDYYWRDVIGLRCRTLSGAVLGVVSEIWATGSNDVLVVCDPEGATRLVPALRGVLARVDLGTGELWIDPPAGLLEDP